jgi:oxygen-independent coproporphyrinogen-3 oxidase
VIELEREPVEGNYFVSTYPPFSCWDEAGADRFLEVLDRPVERNAATPLGLYVHIPFCVERCPYCYYLSQEGRTGGIPAYVEAVTGEIGLHAGRKAIAGRTPEFIYFGGGTPSLLSAAQLRLLTEGMTRAMTWSDAREISFECAPKSVTRDKLHILRDAGVTRISLGVQQLDDEILKANGRVHLTSDVERAYGRIRDTGFDVVNLDLIVGLVGETDETFFSSLEQTLEMAPESLTIYQLEIPLNTPLYRAWREGSLSSPLPSWPTKRERLLRAYTRVTGAGYTWRSAYTAVRDPARHPFVYQDEQYAGADLIGVGASSFSHVRGVNHQNLASPRSYIEALARGRLPTWRGYRMSSDERLVREFVLQLKLGRIELEPLRSRYGVDVLERFEAPLSEARDKGLVGWDREAIEVTPEGRVRVDRMLPAFYREEHRAIRYS